MRTLLHDKVLLLVIEYDKTGNLKELARSAEVPYFKLRYWVKRTTPTLDAVSVQNLYEHLTGKQLDY